MPTTRLATAAEALQQLADWTRQAPESHFALRIKRDSEGVLSRLSLTAATEDEKAASPSVSDIPETDAEEIPTAAADSSPVNLRRAENPEEAIRLVEDLLTEAQPLRLLVRTWLDVSMELEVLSGVPLGQLLLRRFLLTGVHANSLRRAADRKCYVRVFAHITRLESLDETNLTLTLTLVPDSSPGSKPGTDVIAPPEAVPVEVKFAAGEWEAYLITALHLSAGVTGPHHLELRTPEGQVLGRLPVIVEDTGPSTGTHPAAETHPSDGEEMDLEEQPAEQPAQEP